MYAFFSIFHSYESATPQISSWIRPCVKLAPFPEIPIKLILISLVARNLLVLFSFFEYVQYEACNLISLLSYLTFDFFNFLCWNRSICMHFPILKWFYVSLVYKCFQLWLAFFAVCFKKKGYYIIIIIIMTLLLLLK